MSFLFLDYDMKVEIEEFSLPPPELRGTEYKTNGKPKVRPGFKTSAECKYCHQTVYWTKAGTRNVPMNAQGQVHQCKEYGEAIANHRRAYPNTRKYKCR